MKSKTNNSESRGSTNPSIQKSNNPTAPAPRYALRKGLGFWDLTFNGQHATLKHEQGLAYVAYLLLNPPEEPIHGLALALKVRAVQNGQPADTIEIIQERSLGLDAAEAARSLFHKQQELEEIFDDEDQIEPVKQEVLRDLEAIYEFQKKNLSHTRSAAQKASDAVGKAIKRLHKRLANAVDCDGNPSSVLRAFAEHIKHYILIPSGRNLAHGGSRPPPGCGGFFTYERPHGLLWD